MLYQVFLANCAGSPETIGGSELISACLVPTVGGMLSLCVAKPLLPWDLFDMG